MARFDRPFVGTAELEAVFADPPFPRVLENALVFTIVCVLALEALGFALALFFGPTFPGAVWFGGVVVAGWILPFLIVGAVFERLYATRGGLINEAPRGLGLLARPVDWFWSPEHSLVPIVLADIWYGTPFARILLAAGLAGRPNELYETRGGASEVARRAALPPRHPAARRTHAPRGPHVLQDRHAAAPDPLVSMTGGEPAFSSTTLPLRSFLFSFRQFGFVEDAAVASPTFAFVVVAGALCVRSPTSEARR